MKHRVLVTGMGVVTALGVDWRENWSALVGGRCGIAPWTPADVDEFPVKYAAAVDDRSFRRTFENEGILDEPMERRTAFGVAAARSALQDAGIFGGRSSAPRRIGVVVGSGVPERAVSDALLAVGETSASLDTLIARRHRLRSNTGLRCTNDMLGVLIARQNGLRGPVLNINTACAAATQAIGIGFRMVRRGEIDQVVAGGADSVLNFITMMGLHLLGAPSCESRFGDRLCRPFDRDRSGLVAGEGAGMVVLERETSARARRAEVYGEILGLGTSLDAYQVTAPHPEGDGAVLSMQKALRDAGLDPRNIDHVNAHGTSTPLNDPIETKAIKRVFVEGEHYRRLTVTANKSAFGHLIAAAGAPELVSTLLTLKFGVVPPTLNLEHPDPACDLDYVPGVSRPDRVRFALSNSFGFGGLNATLVAGAYHA